jgi:PAS domain S-box-containing protein
MNATLWQASNLLDLTHDSIYVRDMNGIIRYWNRAAEELYGWTAEQAVGKDARALLMPASAMPPAQADAELLRAGRREGELIHARKDGSRIVVTSRWSLQRDEQGDPLAILTTNTDITERKRAEALLAGEKRILEMVAKGDTLPPILDALCRLVENHTPGVLASVLLVEDGRLKHGGAPSLPSSYIQAIDGGAIGPVAGSCGTAAYFAKQIIVSDIASDPLWADFRAVALPHGLRACWSTPILSAERNVIGTFAMYYRETRSPGPRDQEIIEQITHLAGAAMQRKLTEERLQRSEAYLVEAQRLSHTGSWAWKVADRRFIYWSSESFEIHGMDPKGSLPAPKMFWQIVHPEDRDRVFETIRNAIDGKLDFVIEHRLARPDGAVKYVQIIGHPAFGAVGEVVEMVGTIVDLTEQKRAEQALRASWEQLERTRAELARVSRIMTLGQLTATIAHEVNQPIAAARNNASAALRFLGRNPPDLAEVREALGCIVSNAARAGNILGRIHDHINSAPPRKESLDINAAINEIIDLVRNEAVRNGVSIHTSLAAGLQPVMGDYVQLQQVVLNLVLNAIEAMSTGCDGARELSVSTGQWPHGGVLVAVCDSGPGIDPDNIERLFQSFYTTKPSGMGMGLSICRSIVGAHGGRLWVESNEPHGAALKFTVPAVGMGS